VPLTPQPPVLRLHHGVVTFDGRPVVRGVDLEIRRGEVVALLGANGSGKSTLVRAVVGLVPLTAGWVELFGTALPDFRDWRRIGYVPQRTTAAGGVPATVREVVGAGRLGHAGLLRRGGGSDAAAVAAALDTVDLTALADEPVSRLSGGQQQRVLIARALAGQPEFLILDEPMAGLDATNQAALARTVERLVAAGGTVLIVLHEPGLLEPLLSRAVVLRGGRVVHDGPPPAGAGHHAHADHDHVHPHGDSAEQDRGLLA
jgi:zinc transport system ATP-binding protein